jgi:hypothetical protein
MSELHKQYFPMIYGYCFFCLTKYKKGFVKVSVDLLQGQKIKRDDLNK